MRRIEVNYKLVNFEDFDLVHENENIEYKESFDKLPGDIWPTYSAFANTKGGLIILGVSEDCQKIVKRFFLLQTLILSIFFEFSNLSI